jgi:hypothetical protein
LSFNGLTGAVTGVTTGTANTFVALQSFTSGISAAGGITFANDISVNNLRIGQGPVSGWANTVIGENALVSLLSGEGNLAIGAGALASAEGSNNNVAIGNDSLTSIFGGSDNTAIGFNALVALNGTRNNHIAIGAYAGSYRGTGSTLKTAGTGGIYIGHTSRGSLVNTTTNEIVIGTNALGLGSNTAVIGATTQSSATIYGLVNAPSGIDASGATLSLNTIIPSGSTLTVNGNFVANGNVNLGDAVTDAITVAGLLAANGGLSAAGGTFSALTIFTAGISASGGATFNGQVRFVSGLSAAGGTFAGTVSSDTGYRITSSAFNTQTGTTYTFIAADNGEIVTFNNGSTVTVTVPTGLPVGFNCTAIQLGAGQVGFTAASGVTLNAYASGFKIAGQHGSAALISYESNVYNLSGTLTI